MNIYALNEVLIKPARFWGTEGRGLRFGDCDSLFMQPKRRRWELAKIFRNSVSVGTLTMTVTVTVTVRRFRVLAP